MNYEKLGNFVKEKRKAMHLTQIELAELAEVSNTTLKNIERGKKINLDTLKKVLNYLGYDVNITNREGTKIIFFN